MLNHKFWLFVLLIGGSSVFILAYPDKEARPARINGVSFVAPHKPIGVGEMEALYQVNSNWIAITPYAFTQTTAPNITFDHARQWWGERTEGVIETIKMSKEIKHKVMLKPHVWVRGQGWAGDFELSTEEDWVTWEKDYKKYILHYAKIADSLDVEMLCIGTEYRKAVVQRPQFWVDLIKETRKIYSGKLIYAANWDNFHNVKFWHLLDYIGIDAYFPLSENHTPEVSELSKKWEALLPELAELNAQYNKPIVFSEYGYRSIDYTADGHWKYDEDTLSVNLVGQANAYEALYTTLWDEPWFMGGFLWKWHPWHKEHGGEENKRYTPQNKPAQHVIGQWYKQTGSTPN